MAFYNKKMAQNKAITKAWGAAHRKKIYCDEEISLPEICGEIGRWMQRDRRPRSRLSLRSFSVLLSGAIRLYRDQANLLLRDTFNCSIDPIRISSRPTVDAEQKMIVSESSDEQLLDFATEAVVTEVPRSNGGQSESTEYNSDTETLPTDDWYETISEECTVFTITSNEQSSIANHEKTETRDQMTQTSQAPEQDNNRALFDPNLPFGYIIVHDNYQSRIPSKILFSSLSENVKFLPIRGPMN